ncbi:hypothetical protein [Alistipes indistinctus]|uniref:hypothetical protein n=1 Tax=Alistipes indistinctus TaxID=626932 RepID=UPI003A838695
MSKKINVSRDLESRARIAIEHAFHVPQAPAPQSVNPAEPEKKEEDAQSPEEIRPEVDQSPGSTDKPKKAGRTPKRDPKEI